MFKVKHIAPHKKTDEEDRDDQGSGFPLCSLLSCNLNLNIKHFIFSTQMFLRQGLSDLLTA